MLPVTARLDTLSATIWSFVANWGQQLAATAIFFYLAYTLDPADFGVVAMASAAVDLLTMLARFGQVEALLQGDNDAEEINTSYWFLICVGIVFSFLIYVISCFAENWYADGRVPLILMLLAPIPLIQNLTLTQEYLLRRDMAFRGIAVRNVSSTVLSGITAILLASSGFGYFALIAQKLVFTIINSLALFLYRPWHANFQFSMRKAWRLAAAGFNVSLSNLTGMANSRVIDIFVGHHFGFVVLGNLRIAWRLFDLFVQFTLQPVANVAATTFTRSRLDSQNLYSLFLRYVSLLALLVYPTFVGSAVIAGDLVQIIFGARWEMAGDMLSYLCLSFLVIPIIYLFPAVMLSRKRTELMRRQALIQFIFTLITVYYSSKISIEAVLCVHVMRVYLFAAYNWLTVKKVLGSAGRQLEVVHLLLGPLLSTIIMVGAILVMQRIISAEKGIYMLALEVVLGGLTYLCIMLLGEYTGAFAPLVRNTVFSAMKSVRMSKNGK